MKLYFVMLNPPKPDLAPIPMMTEADSCAPVLATFGTYEEARSAATATSFGEAFGFQIFRSAYCEYKTARG